MAQNILLPLAGAALLTLGLILHVVGVATTHWTIAVFPVDVDMGLFQTCIMSICVEYPDKPVELLVCQAFGVMGALFCACAAALGAVRVMNEYSGRPQKKIVAICILVDSLSAVATTAVCVAVWATKMYDSDTGTLGFSFFLCGAGGVVVSVGGVVAYIASLMAQQYAKDMTLTPILDSRGRQYN